MSGAPLFDPARDGHELDKIRHSDPKTARALQRAGGRAAQFAVLNDIREREKKTQVNADGRYKQVHVRLSDEEFAALHRLRGEKTVQAFVGELIARCEQQGDTRPATLTAEAANILAQWQERLHLPSQLATVTRLAEGYEAAAKRAERIRELESAWRAVCEDRDNQARTIQSLTDQLREANAAMPDSGEAHDILLDFLAALAGTTATLDPSGEITVTPAPDTHRRLFGLWQRAVNALGIAGKEATA